jgi:hypothetical protein
VRRRLVRAVGADGAGVVSSFGEVAYFVFHFLRYGIDPAIVQFSLAFAVGEVISGLADRLAVRVLHEIGRHAYILGKSAVGNDGMV